jgi:hypothetical protein
MATTEYTLAMAKKQIGELDTKIQGLNKYVEDTFIRKDNISRTIPMLGLLTAIVNKGANLTAKDKKDLLQKIKGLKTKKKQSGGKKKQSGGKWSAKYKKSINCQRPKGFSQKQYCRFGRNGKRMTRKTRKNKTIKSR